MTALALLFGCAASFLLGLVLGPLLWVWWSTRLVRRVYANALRETQTLGAVMAGSRNAGRVQ